MKLDGELEGVVHNGVIVPDDAQALAEGTRVRIEPVKVDERTTFGQLFGDLVIESTDLPTDLAAQHDHYRLGKPKESRTVAFIVEQLSQLFANRVKAIYV